MSMPHFNEFPIFWLYYYSPGFVILKHEHIDIKYLRGGRANSLAIKINQKVFIRKNVIY